MEPERWREIERVYQQACEMEAGARAAFLDRACGGDAVLRQEVESLLHSEQGAEEQLRVGVQAAAAALAQERSGGVSGDAIAHHPVIEKIGGKLREIVSQATPDRLGPYEIVSLLGAGAMGKVYRARDTRLRREVALKVIIDEVAQDASRLQRFEREARAVAALNHPNIVALFDIGNEGGTAFFVTELVEGKSLRALIQRGKLPLRTVVDISAQLAEGLAAAHAAGITHRDLKPENIMVTDEGRVKILDFGIARRAANSAASRSEATLPADQTEPGAIIGTVNYMSPEQAQGQDLDHRSDQFSFGLILYEMLTGRRAFERPDSIRTMMAIISEDPPPLPEEIPAPLDWILRHCLDKEARHRYTSTSDLALILRDLRDHPPQTRTAETGPRRLGTRPRPQNWQFFALAAVLVAAIAIGGAILLRPAPLNLSQYKFSPFATDAAGQCCAAWSRDGTAVAYIGSIGDKPRLYLRYLDSPGVDIRLPEIPHLAPGGIVAWSADSRMIIAATEEGTNVKLWTVRVGGEPEKMKIPKIGEALALAPDGQTGVTFMRRGGEQVFTLLSFSTSGSELDLDLHPYTPAPFATTALQGPSTLAFSPNGKQLLLMFVGDGKRQSWLIPWPAGSGTPKLVLPELDRIAQFRVPFAWMPDNRHIVLSPIITGSSWGHLYIADTKSGRISQITMGLGSELVPSVSPDGQKLIFEDRDFDLNIVSASLADGKISPLIATAASERMPAWSLRTNRLAYVSDRNGEPDIWLRDENGSDRVLIAARDLPTGCISPLNPTLSPEGSRMIYTCLMRSAGDQLWVASLERGASVRLTNVSGAAEMGGSWSPDARWFAYVERTPAGSSLMRVKTTGKASPIAIREAASYVPDWSPRDDWISYWQDGWHLTSPDGKVTRNLGILPAQHVTFSPDGNRLWFVSDEERAQLISFDLQADKKEVVADLDIANQPASDMGVVRFSISPDGKSLVYATRNDRRNLRLLEGFPQRPFGGIFR